MTALTYAIAAAVILGVISDHLTTRYTAAKTQHTHDTHRDNDMWQLRVNETTADVEYEPCDRCGDRCDGCGERMCGEWGLEPAVTCTSHPACVDCVAYLPDCIECRAARREAVAS